MALPGTIQHWSMVQFSRFHVCSSARHRTLGSTWATASGWLCTLTPLVNHTVCKCEENVFLIPFYNSLPAYM